MKLGFKMTKTQVLLLLGNIRFEHLLMVINQNLQQKWLAHT